MKVYVVFPNFDCEAYYSQEPLAVFTTKREALKAMTSVSHIHDKRTGLQVKSLSLNPRKMPKGE